MQDDTFIVNRQWFETIVRRIKKDIQIPYHCHVRCDLMNEDVAKLLKETGCRSVTFAAESGNQEYREKYLNRRMSNEQIIYTASLLHKYGIKFRIENMVGLPKSSLAHDFQTLALNVACKPTIGWASLYQPYPNTQLGKLCESEGIWSGDTASINPSFFDTSPLNIPDKKKIENLQKIFSLLVRYPFLIPIAKLTLKYKFGDSLNWIYKHIKQSEYQELYGV